MAARVGIFVTFELDEGERHFDPPAAVSSEKGSHYKEASWAPEPVWAVCKEKRIFATS
jgi:hypothetical protein